MDLRSYTKQELAQLYEQLLKSGYSKSSKEFNPLQVSYIFFHLGEP